MIRVLHIVNSMDRGGIETFIMNIYRTLDRTKVQFDFLLYASHGDYESEIESMGGRIYRITARNSSVKGYCRDLKNFFSTYAHEYAAVHQHVSALIAIEPLLYARLYGVPVRVLHAHNSSYAGHPAHGILHRLVRPFVGLFATHFLGCSDKAIDWIYKTSSAYNQAEIIKNGVDVTAFTYNSDVRMAKRQELHIEADVQVWGHIGRFVPVKNHIYLVDIFKAYHQQHPRSILLLLGDGKMMPDVKQHVASCGLDDAVCFMGVREDVPQLLQAIDVFLMPSLYEGLPVSLIEAQAAGLPTFIADTISAEVKITDHLHFIPLTHSPRQWCEAIERELDSFARSDVREVIKQAGYDINTSAERLLHIYKSLMR